MKRYNYKKNIGEIIVTLLFLLYCFHVFFVRIYLEIKIDSLLTATSENYQSNNTNEAKAKAVELLRTCRLYDRLNIVMNYWNYGNAIHEGHAVLGLTALSEGNTQQAIEHLISAGNTPGSPQLNTYGPNMTLALALLKKGERKAVLQYIEECSRFWVDGKAQLHLWAEAIRKGRIPNLKNESR